MEAFFTFEPPQMRSEPYTVTDINRGITAAINQAGTLVLVEAEIQQAKRAGSGHVYLTLTDGQSQIPAVIWRGNVSRCQVEPKAGLQVQVIANIKVYERGGYYQLDILRMADAGAGKKAAELEALKRKLQEEGLFAEERKKEIPSVIQRVGVVTAEGSAALSDILKTVRKNSTAIDIVLSPAMVQGPGAPASLIDSLLSIDASQSVDVIIFGRGGGSAEDLSAFNDEGVVRAIASCNTPVISAVGHEVDVSLSDLVADVRCATPTAAAERVTEASLVHRRRFDELVGQFSYEMRHILQKKRFDFERLSRSYELQKAVRKVEQAALTIDTLEERLYRAIGEKLSGYRQKIEQQSLLLNQLNPLTTMQRGYTAMRKKCGPPVTCINDVVVNEDVVMTVSDGEIEAFVTAITKKELF